MAKVQLSLVQPARPQLLDAVHRHCITFSPTPARDVLRHLPEAASAACVLQLGCADPSCLLTTLAATHPGLHRLSVVLGEPNPMQLARTVFLLLLAAELDPDSQDDMQVLWEVWYCAAWSPATLPRVKPFIERLQRSSVPWLTAVRPEDKDILHYVWSSWLAKDKPTGARTMRYSHLIAASEHLMTRIGGSVHLACSLDLACMSTPPCLQAEEHLSSGFKPLVETAVQQVVKWDSRGDLQDALQCSCSPQEANLDETDLVVQVLQQEVKTYLETKYLAPNYTGQEAIRARCTNITLLRPGGCSWSASVYECPALCWGPFSAAELVPAAKAGSHAGLLARVCIAHITQLVRSFQANTQFGEQSAAAVHSEGSSSSRVQLQVQLVCEDALQLCLGMPLSNTGAAAPANVPTTHQQKPQSPASAVHNFPVALLFDAIESSCLADDVGLLPLLVAAGARLKPAWHARLYIGLMDWQHQGGTLGQYIFKQALRIPLSLTPTLLGLRLLTDLEADRPETAEEQEYTYRADAFRELVWAPIPNELRTSPRPKLSAQLLGGPAGSIEACLQALCSGAPEEGTPEQHKFADTTPHLLAWLLASLAERADMSALLESSSSDAGSACNGTSGSDCGDGGSNRLATNGGDVNCQDSSTAAADARQKYADMQRILWALRTRVAPLLPTHSQLCFKSGIDILRSSLQQHAPKAWQPADVPLCPGVKQLVVPLQLEGIYTMGVRPALVEHKAAHQVAGQLSLEPGSLSAVPAGVHIIDTWASGLWGQRQVLEQKRAMITMHMPSDFILPLGQSTVSFLPVKIATCGHMAKPTRSMSQGRVQAPGILAQLLLPSVCPSTASQVSSPAGPASNTASSQQDAAPLKLQVVSLQETEESYIATLQLVDAAGKAGDPAPGQLLHPDKLWLDDEHCITGHSAQSDSTCKSQWRVSTTHTLTVGIGKPAGQVQPVELLLSWPVATGWTKPYHIPSGSYSTDCRFTFKKADQDDGQVELEIAKAAAWEIWPDDASCGMLPAPLNLSSLQPYTHQSEASRQISSAAQYLPDDMPKGGVQALLHPDTLRALVEDIMLMKSVNSPAASLNTTRFTASCATRTSDGNLCTTSLHLLLHPPVLMTKACRPVLPVTVIDVAMCGGACARGDMDRDGLHKLLRRLGFEPGQFSPWSQAMPDECVGLRRMLLRHALACKPTAAQQASLPDGQRIPYYYHSYLSYMQCLHPLRVEFVPKAKKPSSSATSMYLKNRFMEVLTELSRCDDESKKAQLCTELAYLVNQEGALPLPAEIWAAVSMHLRWICSPAFDDPADAAAVALQAGAACMQCGKHNCKLMTCGKCGAVQYCSRECQVAHWKQHKAVCKLLSE